MKKHRTRSIILFAVLGIAVIVCILIIFISKTKKEEKITIGMTKDEAISILEKSKYKYLMNKDLIVLKEVTFQNIEGHLCIYLDSKDRVCEITFGTDVSDIDKKVQKLNKYLYKTYGETKDNYEGRNVIRDWEKENIKISFTYPNDKDSTSSVYIIWRNKDSK